jgi:hypothetical protein
MAGVVRWTDLPHAGRHFWCWQLIRPSPPANKHTPALTPITSLTRRRSSGPATTRFGRRDDARAAHTLAKAMPPSPRGRLRTHTTNVFLNLLSTPALA